MTHGYESETKLPDGRSVWLQRKIYTWAIVVGQSDSMIYDNHWCYENRAGAEQALAAWNPLEQAEPQGWIRNPQSGRWRPDGDESKQYVSW